MPLCRTCFVRTYVVASSALALRPAAQHLANVLPDRIPCRQALKISDLGLVRLMEGPARLHAHNPRRRMPRDADQACSLLRLDWHATALRVKRVCFTRG